MPKPVHNYYSPAHCFKSSLDNKTVIVSYECETLESELSALDISSASTLGSSARNNTESQNLARLLPFNILWKYYPEQSSLELANTGLCWSAYTDAHFKQSRISLQPCSIDDKNQRFEFLDGNIKLGLVPELCVTGKPSPLIDLCRVDAGLGVQRVLSIVVVFIVVVVICVVPLTISLEYVMKHMFTSISTEQNRMEI